MPSPSDGGEQPTMAISQRAALPFQCPPLPMEGGNPTSWIRARLFGRFNALPFRWRGATQEAVDRRGIVHVSMPSPSDGGEQPAPGDDEIGLTVVSMPSPSDGGEQRGSTLRCTGRGACFNALPFRWRGATSGRIDLLEASMFQCPPLPMEGSNPNATKIQIRSDAFQCPPLPMEGSNCSAVNP